MRGHWKGILVTGAVAAALAPAAAAGQGQGSGKSGGHGQSGSSHGNSANAHANHPNRGQNQIATYNFKGTWNADGTVHVTKGNSRVRKGGFVGQDVQFDFTNADVRGEDVNGDGVVDPSDVAAGDRVDVKARLGRFDPGPQPFAAERLKDKSEDEPAPV